MRPSSGPPGGRESAFSVFLRELSLCWLPFTECLLCAGQCLWTVRVPAFPVFMTMLGEAFYWLPALPLTSWKALGLSVPLFSHL